MVFPVYRRVMSTIQRQTSDFVAHARVGSSYRHIGGPRHVTLRDQEVAVVCLLKDGAYYIEEFLAHHRAMAVSHFLFVDNGSTDGTVELLIDLPDVTVVRCELPIGRYERLMRSQIAGKVFKGGWLLFADSDELVELSHGEGREITAFTAYCNERGFTAVVGQCLDLFSGGSISETADWTYNESIRKFDRYSLDFISHYEYHDPDVAYAWFVRNNTVSHPSIGFKFGGIRREVFGENCGLTNHRFVRNNGRAEVLTHPHCCSNVACADFSLLLRHYKFAGDYLARERKFISDRTWDHGEGERRLAVIQDASVFAISGANEHVYAGTPALVSEGFLPCSDVFLRRFPAIS